MEQRMSIDEEDMPVETSEHRRVPYDYPIFPWMGHFPPVPVDRFPSLTGPIVHEGFVPDDEEMVDGVHGHSFGNENRASAPAYEDFATTGLAPRVIDTNDFELHNTPPRFRQFEETDEDDSIASSRDREDSHMSDGYYYRYVILSISLYVFVLT